MRPTTQMPGYIRDIEIRDRDNLDQAERDLRQVLNDMDESVKQRAIARVLEVVIDGVNISIQERRW